MNNASARKTIKQRSVIQYIMPARVIYEPRADICGMETGAFQGSVIRGSESAVGCQAADTHLSHTLQYK
jgi:hypothetical protein